MASNGIGRLLNLALDALETGDPGAMDPKLWAYEARGNLGPAAPGLPKAGRIGSSNFGVVANVCELVLERQADVSFAAQGMAKRRALGWLRNFYLRQGPDGDLGHCLYEPLSATYGEAHIVSALIAFALGVREAGPFLEKMLALGLLHRCPNGRIVAASTRAGRNPKHWALEEFVKRALGSKEWDEPVRGTPNTLIGRAFVLENGWRAPKWMRAAEDGRRVLLSAAKYAPPDIETTLGSIRFASGPLIWTLHERGHVSRWETGPLCYASPLVAAVAVYDPFEIRQVLYPGKTAAPFGELRTEVESAFVEVWRRGFPDTRLDALDISDLGPVVAEHRFEEVQRA